MNISESQKYTDKDNSSYTITQTNHASLADQLQHMVLIVSLSDQELNKGKR